MKDTCHYKKKIAWCLIGSMLLAMPTTNIQAMETESRFSDISGHWAEQSINRMSSYKIINGYNGLFRPNDPITRGEMAVIIESIMEYQKEAKNIFLDIEEAFYKDAILKAYEEGLLLENNGLLRPRDNATREEVAYMIYNAFHTERSENTISFSDKQDISSWAEESVASLAAKNIIIGSDGKFRPNDPITRAEVVTILNRLLGEYYNVVGTYGGYIEGNTVINTGDANLKDAIITGDLIIAEGVADGDVSLENVIVKGRTIIKGGGIHSIKVKGNSKLSQVVMAKEDAPVRLFVEESAEVSHVTVDKESTDVIIEGKLDTVDFKAENIKIIARNTNIKELNILGEKTEVEITGKTDIKQLNVSKESQDTQIAVGKGAQVKEINAEAKTTIEGTGEVQKVNALANDINIQTKDTQVVAAEGTTGVIAGKEPVKGGTTSNTTTPSTGNNSSNSGNNDSNSGNNDSNSGNNDSNSGNNDSNSGNNDSNSGNNDSNSGNNDSNSGNNDSNSGNDNVNTPEEKPLSIAKIETVSNGFIRFELNEALDAPLTLDRVHILCTSGGKDMTILDIKTSDNKVYELTTTYYDDNTYRLYVYLEDDKLIEKDFVSKYDCAEIGSMEITRTSDTTATLSYVSDAPGKFYYGISEESVLTRARFTTEPTAEELIEKGTESTMNLHLNTLEIEGLEVGKAYTLYYVAVDTTNRVTPVKSISIPKDVIQGPSQNDITIEEATPYYRPGDLFDENYYFVFKLSEPTQTALTLDQFEIVCPADGALTLGRLETKDNQTYTIYMKKGYIPKERNTFKVTITFENGTVATKGFYLDLTAPIITSTEVIATTNDTIQVELKSDEPGKLYYKILDHVETDISAKDPSDIYETGTQVEIGYGLNILKDIAATEGKWFCYATEDAYGNRQYSYGYKQVPKYVEPEKPEEDTLKITNIEYNKSNSMLTVSFNKYFPAPSLDLGSIQITGVSIRPTFETSSSNQELYIQIKDSPFTPYILPNGNYVLQLVVDNQIIRESFEVK